MGSTAAPERALSSYTKPCSIDSRRAEYVLRMLSETDLVDDLTVTESPIDGSVTLVTRGDRRPFRGWCIYPSVFANGEAAIVRNLADAVAFLRSGLVAATPAPEPVKATRPNRWRLARLTRPRR